jgi:hypothetical protein
VLLEIVKWNVQVGICYLLHLLLPKVFASHNFTSLTSRNFNLLRSAKNNAIFYLFLKLIMKLPCFCLVNILQRLSLTCNLLYKSYLGVRLFWHINNLTIFYRVPI